MFASYNVKVSNNFTMGTSEVRKDEGEVKASSAIVKAKNLKPHMFREGEGNC